MAQGSDEERKAVFRRVRDTLGTRIHSFAKEN
jgi:hypothetical protein